MEVVVAYSKVVSSCVTDGLTKIKVASGFRIAFFWSVTLRRR